MFWRTVWSTGALYLVSWQANPTTCDLDFQSAPRLLQFLLPRYFGECEKYYRMADQTPVVYAAIMLVTFCPIVSGLQ